VAFDRPRRLAVVPVEDRLDDEDRVETESESDPMDFLLRFLDIGGLEAGGDLP
jgi:hypothetical protein